MRSEPDLRLNLRRSTLAVCFAVLAGALVSYVVWLGLRAADFPIWIAVSAAVVVTFLVFYWQFRSRQTLLIEPIFRATGGCWLGSSAELVQVNTGELPALTAYQNYFGLRYFENGSGQALLLWPDQLDSESARKLRLWVKAQIRGK
jgi:hypothetical protein